MALFLNKPKLCGSWANILSLAPPIGLLYVSCCLHSPFYYGLNHCLWNKSNYTVVFTGCALKLQDFFFLKISGELNSFQSVLWDHSHPTHSGTGVAAVFLSRHKNQGAISDSTTWAEESLIFPNETLLSSGSIPQPAFQPRWGRTSPLGDLGGRWSSLFRCACDHVTRKWRRICISS